MSDIEPTSHEATRVLVTGATGYIGGRLLRRLHGDSYQVRALARRPQNLQRLSKYLDEVVQADLLDEASLRPALEGIDVAYYLAHSMGGSGEFEEEERRCAHHFGKAAQHAGVKRIIFLGGLGSDRAELSPHLASRHETGEILRSYGVPVIEFRASIIIGSGSLSFEMIRALSERLPLMTTPKWVKVQAQPIAIQDVLDYLEAGITFETEESRVFEIGGTDVVAYVDLMREYCRQRGLKRFIVQVPVLTPKLSSLWLALVTPLYARVGRKLIDSVRMPTLVEDPSALEAFDIQPRGVEQAIAEALRNEDREFAETRWSDSITAGNTLRGWGGVRFGSRLVDSRSRDVDVPAAAAFTPIRRIGGEQGYYFADFLWRVRGSIDLMIGGIGMRRGRRHPDHLVPGDVVDWWRVERVEPGSLLELTAEMKMPGRAWLRFEVKPRSEGGCVVHQTALFDPVGVFGLLYWYSVYPLHSLIFNGMLRNLCREAERLHAEHPGTGELEPPQPVRTSEPA